MTQKLSAVIIHGSGGFPGRNWFPWLKLELEARGVPAIVPQFPTPEGQTLAAWRDTFAKEAGDLSESLVLFGHSTGVAMVLNLLNRSSVRVRAAFLVSGFVGPLNHPVFDPLNATFFAEPFNWEKIRRNAGEFFVYAGDNDPYVPLEKGIDLAKQLNTELIVVPNGGHLNQDSGFTSFPALLRDFDGLRARS